MGKSESISLLPGPAENRNASTEHQTIKLPSNMQMLQNQVAGHRHTAESIGMLKCNQMVLKPILKKECGEREVDLYEKLQSSVDSTLIALRDFVPTYYGVETVAVNDRQVKCIVLDDVTKHYAEPCVMDIKIGKRTWGPDSNYKKIIREDMKFRACKQALGFCIPGYQVYNISKNRLIKSSRNHDMNQEDAENAIKSFLNAEMGICRILIVQFLAILWRIQHWARNQRRLRLYSSSILLVYDARRLKECLKLGERFKSPLKLTRKLSLYRPISLVVLNNGDTNDRIPTGFSGLITKEGPILRSPTSPNRQFDFEHEKFVRSTSNDTNTWHRSIRTLRRTHSFQNNYDKDVQNKKQDYTCILDELCADEGNDEMWVKVKLIDFAHTHPADSCEVDKNYLEGVESLVRLLEDFLMESE